MIFSLSDQMVYVLNEGFNGFVEKNHGLWYPANE